MHIYFSGIGGAGVGPLALIAKQAGYNISGSDQKNSQYIEYLMSMGISDIHIGQTAEQIAAVYAHRPIDWFVYTSALKSETDHPELEFCKQHSIKTSTRSDLINEILSQKKLKMIAIAGTHGKTTTTAMAIWLFKQLDIPVSYSVGGKISFGDMGHYEPGSEYFIYEADEFDRNFLEFHPFFSIISGVGYDHHEIFATEQDYYQAFSGFLDQTQRVILWQEDAAKLGLDQAAEKFAIESYDNPLINDLALPGLYNRRDAWLVVKAVSQIIGPKTDELVEPMNQFPGVSRRFEKITDGLYSDYAHTTEKIKGVMSVAHEMAAKTGQKIIIIYEPLTNRRMHYTKDQHHSVFDGAAAIYWVPSFLAREDPNQAVLAPDELIKFLSPQLQAIAKPVKLDEELKAAIQSHLQVQDLVIGLSGGGGGSLDEWLRREFSK